MKKTVEFWAIAYLNQEDVFYDFNKGEDVLSLDRTCLLPTREQAVQYIEDELCIDYVPVRIEVMKMTAEEFVYSRDEIARWDKKNVFIHIV